MQINDSVIINEFKILPVNLEPIYTSKHIFGSFQIYSNDIIKKEFKTYINNSPILLDALKININKAVDNNCIIPGYINDSKLNFLKDKVGRFLNTKNDFHLGFYSSVDDKIFILLDDNVNLFGKITKDIDKLIVHEMCHMATNQNNNTRIINKTYKNIIHPFYYNYFYELLTTLDERYEYYLKNDLKEKFDKNIHITINQLLKINEKKINQYIDMNKTESIWDNFLNNLLSKFKENEDNVSFLKKAILSPYNHSFLDMDVDPKILSLSVRSIKHSYEQLNVDISKLKVGQEFIFPSEIIAIYCSSKENNFVNNILLNVKFNKG